MSLAQPNPLPAKPDFFELLREATFNIREQLLWRVEDAFSEMGMASPQIAVHEEVSRGSAHFHAASMKLFLEAHERSGVLGISVLLSWDTGVFSTWRISVWATWHNGSIIAHAETAHGETPDDQDLQVNSGPVMEGIRSKVQAAVNAWSAKKLVQQTLHALSC